MTTESKDISLQSLLSSTYINICPAINSVVFIYSTKHTTMCLPRMPWCDLSTSNLNLSYWFLFTVFYSTPTAYHVNLQNLKKKSLNLSFFGKWFFLSILFPLHEVFLLCLLNLSTNSNANYNFFIYFSHLNQYFSLLNFLSNLLTQYYSKKNTKKSRNNNRWHFQSIYQVAGIVLSNFQQCHEVGVSQQDGSHLPKPSTQWRGLCRKGQPRNESSCKLVFQAQ